MPPLSSEATRVLIPGVCHPIVPDTLASLRRAADGALYIIGVDVEERACDFEGVDVHYFVPRAGSPEFVPALLEICRKENVDVVVPWSDAEVEAISSEAPAFEDAGVAVLSSSFAVVRCALDKGSTLERLEMRGVPVPRHALASNPDDIERAAATLGYPDERVVIKPRRSHGCRGMWILDSGANMLEHRPGPGRPSTLATFLHIARETAEAGRTIPDYVLMEYLPGGDFSVDALADNGKALFVVPRRRIKAVEGISQISEIVADPAVRTMVARVIGALNLHLNVNVQLKYSKETGGVPLVYEINPRLSGTIVANDAAGVSLLFYGIQLALGRTIPSPESMQIQETRMFRKWVACYSHKDRWFTP